MSVARLPLRRARLLTDKQRTSIAEYLSLCKGIVGGMQKVSIPGNGICHPSIDRSTAFIKEEWCEVILPQQGLLADSKRWSKVLAFFRGDEIAETLNAKWSAQADYHYQADDINVVRWRELEAEVNKVAKQKDALYERGPSLRRAVKEIMLAFAYPRLDVEVTKKRNHLLKAPFCVHPKTGKVCVPINPANVWQFSPETVPTVQQLLQELKAQQTPSKVTRAGSEHMWEHTAVAPYIKYFSARFLQPLQMDSKKALTEKGKASAKPSMAW